jgi:hypothetical protein
MGPMIFRRLLLVLALSATAWCADYQVVLKPSGKVVHGAFLYEDANAITLQVNSTEVSFKKEKLDLVRMKELNRSQPAAVLSESFGAQPGPGGPTSSEGQALIRELQEHIAERARTLAKYQSQPASAERDRHIQELAKELAMKRRALVDLQLGYGPSNVPGGAVAFDGQALIRELKEQIVERERTLAKYQNEPPSDEREGHVKELEKELLLKRRKLADFELSFGSSSGAGTSKDPELQELWHRRYTADVEVIEAQQAYDYPPDGSTQAEAEERWQRFQDAEKKWHEAQDALTEALQKRGQKDDRTD